MFIEDTYDIKKLFKENWERQKEVPEIYAFLHDSKILNDSHDSKNLTKIPLEKDLITSTKVGRLIPKILPKRLTKKKVNSVDINTQKKIYTRLDVILLHSFDFINLEQVHQYINFMLINDLPINPDFVLTHGDIITCNKSLGLSDTNFFKSLNDQNTSFIFDLGKQKDLPFSFSDETKSAEFIKRMPITPLSSGGTNP